MDEQEFFEELVQMEAHCLVLHFLSLCTVIMYLTMHGHNLILHQNYVCLEF